MRHFFIFLLAKKLKRQLHIDIETFSSVDIKTSGSYKYCQSIDFEILLLAYAYDDQPVEIIDLAQGEKIPEHFFTALRDPNVEKHAHNANFERTAFRAIGYDIPVNQWFCSAVKAAYCGFPLALEKVSEAMKLEEKGKLTTGKALIRYFCIPTKPTKTNGQRHRNLPQHDLEKWELFKEYCINDVIAEREIGNKLSQYPIISSERENYVLDQEINDRGIRIDLDMASKAVILDNTHSDNLTQEMKALTGLDNPNSPEQLKRWLSTAMKEEITTLAKDEIPNLIEKAGSGAAREVLELRKEAAKTSIKKYIRMLDCTCDDQRAHGLFQFYGANRTGRWAGRLIQLQNLPRNYINELSATRDLFKTGDYELVTMAFGNFSDILSQLIRTAFVAGEGNIFAVADFSAIEARVTAWIAGEQWRLDVFSTHGKIYEASASLMFGVPMENVTKGSDYRQKGKVAELALGYQGSVGALKTMGGEAMGLSEEEMKSIVKKWRSKSPAIVKFWKGVEAAAKRAIKTKKAVPYKGLVFDCDSMAMTIQLPSGRKLFYQNPIIKKKKVNAGNGDFEVESITYMGMDQTSKKWTRLDAYGGKLTENIVQAIARDLLAYSMLKLDKEGFEIVMHVHDEAVCEISYDIAANEKLERMCSIMGEEVPWAKGLPLAADGYLTTFYKKD